MITMNNNETTSPILRIWLLPIIIFSTLMLSGCPLLDDSDDTDETSAQVTPTPTPPPITGNRTLTFVLVDETGRLVDNASVSSDTFSIVSQNYDLEGRLVVEVAATEDTGMLRFSKSGHLPKLLYREGIRTSRTESLTLKTRQAITIVDPFISKEYIAEDGASVALTGDSLEREDGNPVGSNLELYITPIDISDVNERNAFPGSFLGLAATDTEPGDLLSFGVTVIDIEDDGVPLQLKEGQTAEVVIPIYATTHVDGSAIQVGDEIPFWILNEDTGVWEEESTGVVVTSATSTTGLALRATTTHFSAFNADIWGGRLQEQNGPSGNGSGVSISNLEWCGVFMTISDLDDGGEFSLRIEQLLAQGPIRSVTRGAQYSTSMPIEFNILKDRPALITVYENGTTRSLRQAFRCEGADRLDLTVSFDNDPAFLNWFAISKPIFDIVTPGGGYEVVSNEVRIGNSFVGDSDDTAEVTSDLGINFMVPNGITYSASYLATDPSPASFAAYLENDEGATADSLVSVEYISEQAPIINRVRMNYDDNGPILEWDVEGADTLGITREGDLLPALSDINADLGSYRLEFIEGVSAVFHIDFYNQYGVSRDSIEVVCADNPFTDLPPCSANAQ